MKRFSLGLAVIAMCLVSTPAAAQEDHSEDYQADPLGLIAHYDTTSYYPTIVDTVEVWICETEDPPQANLTVDQLIANLHQSGIPEYFESMSDGRYDMRLVPGGTTTASWLLLCRGQIWGESTAALLAIPNLIQGKGYAPSLIEWFQTYPLNSRHIMAGFWDGLKNMNVAGIAAAMGRTLGWAGSYTGVLPEYAPTRRDNPMGMMSTGNSGALHVGTIAVNRYAAGWIAPDQVHVYDGGADRVVLNVDWEPGTQMIVLPSGEQGHFLSLGARVAKRHDWGIPKEGVEAYIVKHQCDDEYCYGANRRQIPWPHDTETRIDERNYLRLKNPLKHVLGVGQSLEWNGITVAVTQRTGDQWTVTITDGTEPTPTQPVAGGRDWFADDDGTTHENAINRIAETGITVGCSTDPPYYCPDRHVTRAEMAAFLLRATGQAQPSPTRTNTFADVPNGKWYTDYVHAFAETGVDQGDSGMWRPEDPLTRLEMARWLTGIFPHLPPVPHQRGLFDDVSRDDWATVEGLYRSGITYGCSADPLQYCPDQPVTRGQMASFITRALR